MDAKRIFGVSHPPLWIFHTPLDFLPPPMRTQPLFLLADCREEQYPCTRLYSVHKPCKQCLNEICFYR